MVKRKKQSAQGNHAGLGQQIIIYSFMSDISVETDKKIAQLKSNE